MASRAAYPLFKAWDSSNALLVGGKLYTYDPGTLDVRTTYQDAAGTVPHTNPIILNAVGEAEIFISGDTKFVLKDSADVQLWSKDSIVDGLGDLINTDDVALGDALVGVKHTGTGAVATTQHEVNERIIHYMDFGGDGIGVADNTTNLQAAIDATPFGGALDLGSSGIRITGNVSRLTPIHITGNGWEIIPDIDAVTDAVTLGNSAVSTYGWSMKGGGIYTSTGTTNKCQNGLVIQRLHVSEFDVTVLCAAALYGVKISGTVWNDYKLQLGYGSPRFTTSYVRSANGIWVHFDGVNQVNACKFDYVLSGHAIGLLIDDQIGGGQSNYTGTIEACSGNPMEATNVHGANFHDMYFETNTGTILLTGVKHSKLTNWKRGAAVTSQLSMVGCADLDVSGGQHRGDTWSIDATSRDIQLSNFDMQGGDKLLLDAGWNTTYGNGIQNVNSSGNPVVAPLGHDRKNYATNSNFERWTTVNPFAWNNPAAVTWTKTGTGLADTINRVSRFAAHSSWTAVGNATFTPEDKATLIEHIRGRSVHIALPMYFPTTVPNAAMTGTIFLRVRIVSTAAGNTDYTDGLDQTILDAWQDTNIGGLVIPDDITDIQFNLFGGDAVQTPTEFYIADVSVIPDTHGPRAYAHEVSNISEAMTIKGNRIDFQAGIPAATNYLDGDVIYNSPATVGQPIGWVCTVDGTTLVAMANL
jgi:hypothetical protein